jgi:hypothetical protein
VIGRWDAVLEHPVREELHAYQIIALLGDHIREHNAIWLGFEGGFVVEEISDADCLARNEEKRVISFRLPPLKSL